MSVWRIGSRWSKKGDETKSLIQVFIKNKVVFVDLMLQTKTV